MSEESGNTPSSKPYRYPLDLVATIAAILKGCESIKEAVREPRKKRAQVTGPFEPEALKSTLSGVYSDPDAITADQAVSLLYACERRLQKDEWFSAFKDILAREREKEEKAEAESRAAYHEISQQFPGGCTYKKGILFITGRRSEAEAVRPYKQWLQYRLLVAREPFLIREKAITLIALDAASRGKSYEAGGIEGGAKIMAAVKDEVEAQLKSLKKEGFWVYHLHQQEQAFQAWYAENKIVLGRKQGGFRKAVSKPEKLK